MNSTTAELLPWRPTTEEDRDSVRRQMLRLLQTKHFRNSRRYPALFKFIVEETLEGRGDLLKERLLGIRVFDRPPDYDTAADPIVRVTVAEIRKRIAQYYHEEAHVLEMRIELVPGRYEPEFRPRREVGIGHYHPFAVEVEPDVPVDVLHAESVRGTAGQRTVGEAPGLLNSLNPLREKSRWRSWTVRVLLGTGIAALLAFGVTLGWRWMHPAAIEEFWGPLLSSHQTVTFCMPAGIHTASEAPPSPTFLDHESLGENVVLSDVLATVKISDLMAEHHRASRIRLNITTTLDDLQQGPAVLIGGLDNPWTLRAIAPLRFHFAGSDAEAYWIADSKSPEKKDWALDLKTQYDVVNRDYAIIARIHDKTTGQIEVVAAGIGMSGTAAAGEFLVNPRLMEDLRRKIGSGFKDRDFEAVLSTDVVHGVSGEPQILATAIR
jgi:hypothetical protein